MTGSQKERKRDREKERERKRDRETHTERHTQKQRENGKRPMARRLKGGNRWKMVLRGSHSRDLGPVVLISLHTHTPCRLSLTDQETTTLWSPSPSCTTWIAQAVLAFMVRSCLRTFQRRLLFCCFCAVCLPLTTPYLSFLVSTTRL